MSICPDERFEYGDRDFAVEVAIDTVTRRLACVYTRGLWWFGHPELYAAPPEEFTLGRASDDPALPVFLATALAHLGRSVLEADEVDGLDDVEYLDVFEGRPASVWLGPAEPTEGPLLVALPESAASVIRVGCSLWEPAVMRSGRRND